MDSGYSYMQCNSICKYLKLMPFKNGKPVKKAEDGGVTVVRGGYGETGTVRVY